MGLMFYIFSAADTIPLFSIYPSLAFLTPTLDIRSSVSFGSFADVDMSAFGLWLDVYNFGFLLLNQH